MMHLTQCPQPALDLGGVVNTCGATQRSHFWKGLLPLIVVDITFQSQPLSPSLHSLTLTMATMKLSSIFVHKLGIFFLARQAHLMFCTLTMAFQYSLYLGCSLENANNTGGTEVAFLYFRKLFQFGDLIRVLLVLFLFLAFKLLLLTCHFSLLYQKYEEN